ncbi:hypothetical protein TNCV_2126741 [Trichonephila clavipes]|nr:hypothetical protein TNCV_2126741 [Trichonephila clavipes]
MPPTTMSQTKTVELISYGWTAAIRDSTLQWVPSHAGVPGNERAEQKVKQGAEATYPEVSLTLRRPKRIISTYIDKNTAMTSKNE